MVWGSVVSSPAGPDGARPPNAFGAFSGWNQRTFYHLHNNTFVIFTAHFGCVQRRLVFKNCFTCRGGVWLLQYGIQKLNRGYSSGCISMFSVNMTFDKTLMKHFCYFFCKSRHFLSYKCVSIQNSTWILLRFLRWCTVSWQLLSCSSWTQKKSIQVELWILTQLTAPLKLRPNGAIQIYYYYYYYYWQQNCIINVLSKVRLTENIEIQPEPRFFRVFISLNTLNIYRRRRCLLVGDYNDFIRCKLVLSYLHSNTVLLSF